MLSSKRRELLTSVECKNLYEFLKLDRSATPAELCAAAQKVFDRIQNKGLRGPRWDVRKELAGLCKSAFRDAKSKSDYDRDLEEETARRGPDDGEGPTRKFDEETKLFEGAWDLVKEARIDEALVLVKQLTGDYPPYSRLRVSLARLMIARERYSDALVFSGWCCKEEPNKGEYEAIGGIAVAKAGTANWTKLADGGVFATSAAHITDAKECLEVARESARAVGRRDDELLREVEVLEESIGSQTQGRWTGNKLAVVVAVLYAGGWSGWSGLGGMSWLIAGSTAVYFVSSWDPQWKVNARLLKAGGDDVLLIYVLKAFLIVWFLPFCAAVKFCYNWRHVRDFLAPHVGRFGRGTGVLLFIGVLATISAIATRIGRDSFSVGDDILSVRGGGARDAGAAGEDTDAGRPAAAIGTAEGVLGLDRSRRRQIQGGLSAAGFDAGAADGLFGSRTREAIRAWQADRGGSATGYLNAVEAEELIVLGGGGVAAAEARRAADGGLTEGPGALEAGREEVRPTGNAADTYGLSGVWGGVGVQGGSSWTVEVTFGDRGASIRYPSLQCGGELELISASATRLEYLERMTFGLGRCQSRGRVVLERTSDDNLRYNWHRPNGALLATGDLTRRPTE